MLKRISVDDLRLGMHLHALCGPWVDHPFWKTKFVLRDPADLARLRSAGIAECWIDASKGLDVEPALPAAVPAAPGERVAPSPPPPAAKPPGPRVGLESELRRAVDILKRSREAVQSLLTEARLGRAISSELCLPLVDDIAGSIERNPDAFVSLVRLKTHDGYSYLHSVAVCALMVALARRLGCDDVATREAGLAGLLHDIGKTGIPVEILNKPGRLDAAEYEIVRTHPAIGHALLLGSTGVSEVALDVCLHHHERPDGKGYPHGLSGDLISQVARMGAVCDVYDAVTSNRPYKRGWDPAEAIAQMAGWCKGGQFDAAIFRAFLDGLGVYPVGSLVRMRSGRLGVVVAQNAEALHCPQVKIFFSTRSQMPVPVEVLDTSSSACTDRVAARESNERWQFPHLAELWAGRDVLGKVASV